MRAAIALIAATAAASAAPAQLAVVPDMAAMKAQIAAMQQQLAQQAMVQQQTVTLDASGNATWTFSPAFAVTPVVVHMPAAMDTVNPITCNYTARSATSVSVHCWRTSLLGLLTNLYSGSVTGAQVTLVARAIP